MLITDPKSECPTQHLHLTIRGTHATPCQKGMPNTYIWTCRNTFHNLVNKAQHSHLTMQEHIPQPCQKGPALTSDHAGTHPTTLSERPSTHMQSCGNTSHNPIGNAQHSHSIMREHIPQPDWKCSALISDPKSKWPTQHLHLTMRGTHPTSCQKGMPNTHI